jgi:hypothetical protein
MRGAAERREIAGLLASIRPLRGVRVDRRPRAATSQTAKMNRHILENGLHSIRLRITPDLDRQLAESTDSNL